MTRRGQDTEGWRRLVRAARPFLTLGPARRNHLLACLSAGWALAHAGTGPWGIALAAGVGAVLADSMLCWPTASCGTCTDPCAPRG